MIKLPEDTLLDAETARAKGWEIDEDLWWWRARKPGDLNIRNREEFGFTMPLRVFVRSAAQAHQYDSENTLAERMTR